MDLGELLGHRANIPVMGVGAAATIALLWQMAGRGRRSTPAEPRPTARAPAGAERGHAAPPAQGLADEQLARIVSAKPGKPLSINLGAVKHPVLVLGQRDREYLDLIDLVQKYWLKCVSQRTGLTSRFLVTDHFWIVCNNDFAGETLRNAIEPALQDIRGAFPTKDPLELWPGHMPVLLCTSEREFKQVAQATDGRAPEPAAAGYFEPDGSLGHIVCQTSSGDAGQYLDLINHVGRAFLYYYGAKPGPLPRWAAEGAILALQANSRYGAGMRGDMRQLALRTDFFAGGRFESIFADKGFDDPDVRVSQAAHALAFCVCDYLMSRNAESFARMLWLLKDMKDQEEVLITNYGWGFLDLQEEIQQAYAMQPPQATA